LASITSDFVGI